MEISTEIKTDSYGSEFISTTKELLNHPFFEDRDNSHHYPNCEICNKYPDKNKTDEKWFVGYNWGEWFSIFICEDCIKRINEGLKNASK